MLLVVRGGLVALVSFVLAHGCAEPEPAREPSDERWVAPAQAATPAAAKATDAEDEEDEEDAREVAAARERRAARDEAEAAQDAECEAIEERYRAERKENAEQFARVLELVREKCDVARVGPVETGEVRVTRCGAQRLCAEVVTMAGCPKVTCPKDVPGDQARRGAAAVCAVGQGTTNRRAITVEETTARARCAMRRKKKRE